MDYQKFVAQFQRAKERNCPIVAIATPDQYETARVLAEQCPDFPAIVWNSVGDLRPLNAAGEEASRPMSQQPDFISVLGEAAATQDVILFAVNCHMAFEDAFNVQAAMNFRDAGKQSGATLVLLHPGGELPREIRNDIVQLDEPRPDHAGLKQIITETIRPAPAWLTDDVVSQTADQIRGCHAFAAEQMIAMAATKAGMDSELLKQLVSSQLAQTPGIVIEKPKCKFDDIRGLGAAKRFGSQLFGGKRPPKAIIRVEELDKVMGGVSGDRSGVSQDALQVLLTAMEDNQWRGMLAFGCPGSGKSLFSQALAAEHDVWSIRLDINASRGELVGQSEAKIRDCMKLIESLAGEDAFFVASCNGVDSIPPELQRRFRCGIWYFDLPSDEERAALWALYTKKFGVEADYDEPGLTGADVRNLCELAGELGISVKEARQYIVPFAQQSASTVEKFRAEAEGRFVDASAGGAYKRNAGSSESQGRRRIGSL